MSIIIEKKSINNFYLILFNLIIVIAGISDAWAFDTTPCKRAKEFDLANYNTADDIRKALLTDFPIGSRADCVMAGSVKRDLMTDVLFQEEPINIHQFSVIRYRYRTGVFQPKEYWIEVVRRLKPVRQGLKSEDYLLTSEIEDFRIREITDEERKTRDRFLALAPRFNIDSYKNETEAQAAFLMLHPIGSPAHLAHYTLLKAGGISGMTINHNYLNDYGTKKIVSYRFKRGFLGWGGYYVDIMRKVEHGIILNQIEEVKLYKTYQGL